MLGIKSLLMISRHEGPSIGLLKMHRKRTSHEAQLIRRSGARVNDMARRSAVFPIEPKGPLTTAT